MDSQTLKRISPVGFKLPLGWRDDPAWGEISRAVGGILPYLAQRGFSYVEYSASDFGVLQEVRAVREAAAACADLGLRLALHPYLEPAVNAARYSRGPQCRRAIDRVMHEAHVAADTVGQRVVVVFHPAASVLGPGDTDSAAVRKELMEQSRLFLAELAMWVRSLAPGVLVVVEHQVPPYPGESVVRIGETYVELLEAVRGTDLPLCWDTGHYLLSVDVHGQPAEPSDEFVRRVAHVHLHDVVEGDDHRPITPDSHRVAGYMRTLWNSGFDGGITLEHGLETIRNAQGLERIVEESLDLLGSWAETAAGDDLACAGA